MGQMSQRSSVIHACGRTTRTRHAIPRRTLSGTTHGEALAKPRHSTFGTTRMYTFFCIFRLSCLHALSPFLVFGSGKAGGGILPNPDGSERAGPGDAKFTSTIHAKQGDLGSLVLKKGPSQATWRAGAEVEVMWSMRSNHGGGVQWRLCPVEDNLTEACMQRNPIPFVGRQYLLYRNGTRQLLKSKYAVASYQPGVTPKSEPPATGYMVPGTGFFPNATCPGGYGCPVGATWALNPIPVRPHSLNLYTAWALAIIIHMAPFTCVHSLICGAAAGRTTVNKAPVVVSLQPAVSTSSNPRALARSTCRTPRTGRPGTCPTLGSVGGNARGTYRLWTCCVYRVLSDLVTMYSVSGGMPSKLERRELSLLTLVESIFFLRKNAARAC